MQGRGIVVGRFANFISKGISRRASSPASATPVSFQTYDDALAACGGKGYGEEKLVHMIVEKNLAFRGSLKSARTIPMDSLRVMIGIGSMSPSMKLRVLDFGGAGGHHYSIVRTALDADREVQWNVVETVPMVRAANKELAGGGLKFFESIERAASDLGQVDLVFTSGALQYTSNPLVSLSMLLEVKAKHLFITRTAFNNASRRIITLQASRLSDNGPGPLPAGFADQEIQYPVTFESKATAERLIRQRYSVRFAMEEGPAYRRQGPDFHMYGYFCELNETEV
jgi:putative methyltransferase (TIGR04325 family)